MAKPVISVREVSKKYRIGQRDQKADTILAAVLNGIKSPLNNLKRIRNLSKLNDGDDSVFWALKDISFDVQEGEVLGIIGHNGAGKSTLLKILSRITEPSTGEVHIQGRIAALLEVGTGFHPELTGRENIYMNGTILGMRKKEIDKKLDEIVDFSGVEKHLDTPVKFYSSGMRVRLGFSVAAHLEPEILIIDEVLSVGDAEFQKKCLGKMKNISQKNGKTVLFVSHDLVAIGSLCERVVLLENGKIAGVGNPSQMVKQYLTARISAANVNLSDFKGSGDWIVNSISLSSGEMDEKAVWQTGDPVSINIRYSISKFGKAPYVILVVRNSSADHCFFCFSKIAYDGSLPLKENGTIKIYIPKLPLLPGQYSLDVTLKYGKDVTYLKETVVEFEVHKGDFFGTGRLDDGLLSSVLVEQQWSFYD